MNNYPILSPLHQEGDIEDNTQHPHAVTRRDSSECKTRLAACSLSHEMNITQMKLKISSEVQ